MWADGYRVHGDDRAARDHLSGDEAKRSLLGEKQPSGEFVTPEQLGEMVVFLASDAAEQMTGTTMSLDGGWTAR